MLNKKLVLELAKKHDSFYLYDEKVIVENTERLKHDFKHVDFLYSIKTNSHPLVVKSVLLQGFGVDAASVAEVMLGKQNGVAKKKIQYSAPGKTKKDIEQTIDVSTIIADSLNEIMLIQQVAQEKNMVADIGIRINPNFSFYGEDAIPSKFGIDEQLLFEVIPQLKQLKNMKVVGLHIHLRSQELNASVLEKYYSNMVILAENFQKAIGQPLTFLNMGSGIGIPFSAEDTPLDTVYLGAATAKMMSQFRLRFPNLNVYIETGRYVVGKSGFYVTKVLDKKVSCGKTFLILKNTLNGFIRPSLAQLVMSYTEQKKPFASEPLFTCANPFELIALSDAAETEEVTLVGNLCTAADVVAKDIVLPKLQCQDVIVFTNAGSYAAVLSPMQFSSQEQPAQIFLSCKQGVINIDDAE
ncbi:MAG: alanine racemase [Anaerotignum sp.]|nr:alanine racemase [Anaerotignum sp.]